MVLEFLHDGEMWRCGRTRLLETEFDLAPLAKTLPAFADAISTDTRRWQIVCRLFGISPVAVPLKANPDDFRTFSVEELCATLGITQAHLQQELGVVRGRWNAVAGRSQEAGVRGQESGVRGQESVSRSQGSGVSGQSASLTPDSCLLTPGNDPCLLTPAPTPPNSDILQRFDLTKACQVPGQPGVIDEPEQAWFAARATQLEKLLAHEVAGGLARMALLNELRLRRAEVKLCEEEFGSRKYQELLKLRQDTETVYQSQLQELDRIAPWAGAVKGKMDFLGMADSLVRCVQEWEADGNNVLADGIFTFTEVQVLLRQSKQRPEPQYRAGLVVYLNAAKEGLWDQNWRSRFSPGQLRRLDAGFKAAAMMAGEKDDAPLPDLYSDDPKLGEYEELSNELEESRRQESGVSGQSASMTF